LLEQLVTHSDRLGSILNKRARHSATHVSLAVMQPAKATQLAQPPIGCASAMTEVTHAIKSDSRIDDLIIRRGLGLRDFDN
jgi:hypothetical protein